MINLLQNKAKYSVYKTVEKEFFECWFTGLKSLMGGDSFDSISDEKVKTDMLLQVEKAAYNMMDNMPAELLDIRQKFADLEVKLMSIEATLTAASAIGIVYVKSPSIPVL